MSNQCLNNRINFFLLKASSSNSDSNSLNSDILRRGGAILLCDYLCENIGNVEQVRLIYV